MCAKEVVTGDKAPQKDGLSRIVRIRLERRQHFRIEGGGA
jgi:hypothetical protein